MTSPLLDIRDVHVTFPVRGSAQQARQAESLHALDGVSLELQRGEALGLVGESGSGKTTLAQTIAGLRRPTSGEICFEGSALPSRRPRALARRIGIVFQDPYSSLDPRMTVRQALAELLRVHQLVPRRDVEGRCLELVDLVGLPAGALDRYPHQFSGGQRQRIAIARALALEPELLVADEPVSALDVSVQVAVLRLFADLRAELDLTLLFVSHDLAVVRHLCDRVAVMYLGRIVEEAPVRELFDNPRHPYTQSLLAAVPRLRERVVAESLEGEPPSPIDLPPGCRFGPRCPHRQSICVTADPELTGSRPGSTSHRAACHFAWTAEGSHR